MQHIACMLFENAHLTELDLSRNGIGDKGVHALVPALRKNRNLKVMISIRNALILPIASIYSISKFNSIKTNKCIKNYFK